MKKIMYSSGTIVSLLLMLFLLPVTHVRADGFGNGSASTCTWGRFGLGGRISSGLALGVGIMHSRGKQLYTLSTTLSDKNERSFMSTPEKEDWTIGLLYGRVSTAKLGTASISAGAGIVWGSRKFGKEDFGPTIALLGEAQLTFRPASFFGLSLHGNTTIHTKGVFVVILLSLNIGKLK